MAPKGEPYNVDWVWSSTANVHVANHRAWFTNFTPFSSHLQNAEGTKVSAVDGIGDVELEVRKLVGEAAKKAQGKKNSTIVLRNVLYAPGFVCNIMGKPVTEEYDISIGAERWLMDKRNGAGVGLLDRNEAGLTKVVLKGQAKGQSSLKKDQDHQVVQVTWPDEERQRWQTEGKK